MKSTLKKVINGFLSPCGLKIIRNAPGNGVSSGAGSKMASCHERIAHAAKIGFQPKCIIDGGAFEGAWTSMVHEIYPEAQILVVEPNPHVQPHLRKRLDSIHPRPILEQKALADRTGHLKFNIWGDPNRDTSASLQNHVQGEAALQIDVEVTTVDNLIDLHQVQPELIKLDLQGAELKALRGAEKALKSAEMFIVEFGCLQAYIDRATPHQLLEVFYDNEYCLYDIVDLIYRPYDGALTGGDFFFVKNSSALKAHLGYH